MIRTSLTALILSACFPRVDDIQLNGSKPAETGDSGWDTSPDTDAETGWVDTGGETGVFPPDDTAGDSGETGRPKDTGLETGNTGQDTATDTGEPCTEEVWYADMDGDGYGNVEYTEWQCTQPTGYVAQAGDYDDTDASVRWSPCQTVLAALYVDPDAVLWPGSWDDQGFTVSLSTSSQYVTTYWEDSSAPNGYWLVCGGTDSAGTSATLMVQEAADYYANTFTVDGDGAWEAWNSTIITGATREDGTVFYYSGDVGGNAHLEP